MAAVSPAAADERVATRFEMFGLAGLHVLSMTGNTEESGDHYAVTLDYMTTGMARVFVDVKTHVQVKGRLIDGSAQPETFRDESRRNGTERRSRVDYHPGGDVEFSAAPNPPTPIPPGKLRGAIDNLTAYFRLDRQLARTEHCAMTAHVFDGRHGYDLVFADAGQQRLQPTGGQNYSGNAIACRMTRHIWPESMGPESDEGARGGLIWYARLIPGDLMVPVRTEMDTQLGVVHGFLAELHGRGVDLILMK
jgi:hypothetical protein